MDVLADVLRVLRLRGTVYFRASFRAPWGLDVPGGEHASFHIIGRGHCWVRSRAHGTTRLAEGDVVLFPTGDPHALVSEPAGEALPASSVMRAVARADAGESVFGGDGPATTTLVCGHFAYDRSCPHPLFGTLGSMVHVSTPDGGPGWLAAAAELAAAESAAQRPGSSVVVDRLAEALLIQTLLGYLATLDGEAAQCFVAAVRDERIGRALAAMHARPGHRWTLAALAREARMAQSPFTQRFRTLVGQSPMRYLASWRLLKARDTILETSRTSVEIAEAAGYRSEFAFAKAFKRLFGVGPGAVRASAGRDRAARLR